MPGSDFEIGADDLIDSLEMAFIGTLGVRKGKWSFMANVIYLDVGDDVDIPAKDVEEERVAAFFDENVSDAPPLILIHSGASVPDEAFVTVQYRDSWFWIDDTDLVSKRVFSFLMMLMSLTETGTKTGAPIVTVPTN